jgi:hypothetical protein
MHPFFRQLIKYKCSFLLSAIEIAEIHVIGANLADISIVFLLWFNKIENFNRWVESNQ